MKTWKSVPIPELMKDLEVDKRGYPIPYIVLRDKFGEPHFTINDDMLVEVCIEKELCSICGNKLGKDQWLVGGPLSAFHSNGAYVDIPIHYECGVYALQVCPYMAFSIYKAKTDVNKIDVEKFDNASKFINPSQTNDRVPFFVFVHISGYKVSRPHPEKRFIKPNKPYLHIELWNDGKRISEKEAKELILTLK